VKPSVDGQPIMKCLNKAYGEAKDDVDRRFLFAISMLADEYFDGELENRETVTAQVMGMVQDIIPELRGIA
jgi:hypothetical protein